MSRGTAIRIVIWEKLFNYSGRLLLVPLAPKPSQLLLEGTGDLQDAALGGVLLTTRIYGKNERHHLLSTTNFLVRIEDP